MTDNTPEWSVSVKVAAIGSEPEPWQIEADAAKRDALARRFGLEAIDGLSAELTLVRDGSEIRAAGTVFAAVIQRCVTSGEPVPARIDEPFDLLFRPETAPPTEEEVELDERDLEMIDYAGDSIDIGEAAAQTMALALDPFPRSPQAEEAAADAGLLSEEEAGPFGALKGLRDQLAGDAKDSD